MPTQDGIQYASEFQLDALTIVSASGGVVDLREVMRELNLFEDLFSNTMTGSLFIADTQNLINILPIVGVEHLIVTLIKPSSPWKISKTFRIYKITDRRKSGAASEDYILHFCSEELILSESLKISKSYKGMTVSSIISDITTNYLKIDSLKFPLSALTATVGNFDVVIPYWTPFQAINWLSRMAHTGTTTGCSFVFFEDGLGYHFNAIETMSQQEPLQIVNFMPMNLAGETSEKGDKSDTQTRLESAEEYELNQAPDLLKSISGGMYASKLRRVNTLDQQIKTTTQNGIEFFGRTKHPNKNTFMQTGQDRTRVIQPEHFDAFHRSVVDNLRVETWLLQRNAYMAALHGFQVKVSLPGNMNLRVGQVVVLNLPSASIGLKDQKPMDTLFSGRYIITAIRHKVDRTKYACVLELSKDSLEVALPGPLEGSSAMKTIRQA
jgi:hypothetical protein